MLLAGSAVGQRLLHWKLREDQYKRELDQNGSLKRSDWWHYEYCQTPYLTFASDRYLAKRWIDNFHNNVRLTAEGYVVPREEFSDAAGLFGPLFAHLTAEYGLRGGVPFSAANDGNAQLSKYFEHGEPTGVRLFNGMPETLDGVIVKFGKRAHLKAMLDAGDVRATPASYYSRPSLLKAMQDFEVEREFHVPVFGALIKGEKFATVESGYRGEISDGFVKESVKFPDYILWCACTDIDRRMPDDFGADSALIIRDPHAFAGRFKKSLKARWSAVKVSTGPVTYYDPCSFVHRKAKPAHLKHFSFAYQREWRLCAFLPPQQIPEEPFNMQIGSLTDIAELVTL